MNKEFEESRKSHYAKKSEWHKKYAPIMADIASNRCEICNREANVQSGVIHHKQYTGNDYEKPLEKLLEDNAIQWLCKKCHKYEHVAFCKEEVSFKVRHSGYCAICNQFEWKAWFFNGSVSTMSVVLPLCKKCKLTLIDLGIMKWINNSRQVAVFSEIKELSSQAESVLSHLNKKLKDGQFGNPTDKLKWQNPENTQTRLF